MTESIENGLDNLTISSQCQCLVHDVESTSDTNGQEKPEPDYKELYHKLEIELQKRCNENEILKGRISAMEKESKDQPGISGQQPSKNQKKKNQDDLLTKAKELLFEKTKICKRQELQVQALNVQIDSIKDVLSVTKEMLEIRNVEIEHLQSRMDTIDLRLKAEREKHSLLEKRYQISQKMYKDLKKEYDIQSNIFKELRQGYEEKNKLLSSELDKYMKAEQEMSNTKP